MKVQQEIRKGGTMAKVIILNATPFEVKFKGEWEVSLIGKDHAEKTVKPYGDNWIDTIWYDLHFGVTTKDEPYIDDNHGTVKGVDTYAFIVYAIKEEWDCTAKLTCGNRKNLFDAPGAYKDKLEERVKCLKEEIQHSGEEAKKKLEEDLEKVKEALKRVGLIITSLEKSMSS